MSDNQEIAMLAWFRKRKENALKKLLFQNHAAAAEVASFYASHGNPALAKEMTRLGEMNAQLRGAFERGERFPSARIGALVAINEELRRHDQHLFGSALHFDSAYEPAEGWRTFYASVHVSPGPKAENP